MKITFKSIKGKILLFALISSGILLLIVGVTVWQSQKLSSLTGSITKERVPASIYSLKLLNAISRTNSDTRSYLLQKDESFLKNRALVWQEEINPLMNKLKSLSNDLKDDEIKNYLDSLLINSEKLNLSQQSAIDLWKELKQDRNFLLVDTASGVSINKASIETKVNFIISSKLNPPYSIVKSNIDKIVRLEENKINHEKNLLEDYSNLQYAISFFLLALGVAGSVGFSLLLIKSTLLNMDRIKDIIQSISKGNIPSKVQPTDDELGAMMIASNELVDNLENVKVFATEVGNGNFETNINVFNNQGELGGSLAGMRESLIKVAEEDKKRNWSTNGLAQIGEILRNNTASADELYLNIISFLVRYLKSNQGGMFVINDDNKDDIHLELVSCYAFDKKKHVQKRINIGEGLVGQAVLEKDTIYMTEIPNDYIEITSGLGGSNPRSVLIVPLKVNDEIHGVIEIASFNKFELHEIEFMKKLAESIASTISSVKINERTKLLLEQSQQMTEQMRSQEEEMRQNMEELQATQEEISRKQSEMDGQMSAINSTSAFVEFDLKGFIVTANDIFLKTMKYSLDEIKGKHHRLFVETEYGRSSEYDKFWQNLRTGIHQTGEFKSISKDGAEVWLLANYTPVLDENGTVIKVIKLASDITKEKIQNSDFRGQLEAIGKSTAVIEFNLDGFVLKANPIFCSALGYEEKEIVGRHHSIFVEEEYRKSTDYKDFWKDLGSGNFKSGQYKRITKDRSEIWIQATYNCIFDLNGKPFKVVKYAYDITAAKLLELEAQQVAEELKSQEEELRQNMEELQATQEEMERKQMEMDGTMSAIDSTSAFIEFTLNGEIVHANDLFLKTMKYSLSEIVGKHHRIFVDPEYSKSSEYDRFWRDLREGKHKTGEFKRIASDNSEIYIIANYTPVLDKSGKPIKVIKLASDVTNQKLKAADYQGQLEAIRKSTAAIEFDLEGNILAANPIFCDVMGYSEKEVVGKHHGIFVDPIYRKSSEYKDFWKDLKSGEFKSGEFARFNKSGDEIWIQGSYNPIHDLNGKPYKVVKFANDITVQKQLQVEAQQAAEELRSQEEELRQNMEELQATQEEINRKQVEMDAQFAAINTTSAYIEFDNQGLILDANTLFLKTLKYSLDQIKGKHHRMFVDADYAKSVDYEVFWSSLRAGVPQTGEFKRVSNGGSEVWIIASYTPVLDQKGNVIKVIKLASDVTEQKLKTANFQGQLEAINKSSAVIEFDLDGNILAANPLFCDVMGYGEKEIVGKHHGIFVDPTYRKSSEYKDFWKDLKTGEFKAGEFKRVNRAGDEIWIQGSYNPIHDLNGKPYKVVKFASDITMQKQLQLEAQKAAEELRSQEEELRQNMEELQATQDEMSRKQVEMDAQFAAIDSTSAYIEFDPDGNILTANEIFLTTMKYKLDEIRGKHHRIFVEAEYARSKEYDNFWFNLKAGKAQTGEFKRVSKDNSEVWIVASYTPVLDKSGKVIKVMKLATDITVQKLKNSDYVGQLDAINKSSAVIEFDLEGYILKANELFCDLMGYVERDIVGKHHSLFVDPEVKKSAEYKEFWKDLKNGDFKSGQFKRVNKAGEEIWIQGSYNAILDLNAKPSKVVKYANDITEKKKMELETQQVAEQLKAQEEELRQNMEELQTTQDEIQNKINEAEKMKWDLQVREYVFGLTTIMSESDKFGNILMVNKKLCEISKYSKEELIGKPHNIFRHPDMPKELFKLFWDTIKAGNVFKGIVKNKAKDNSHYWVDATIVPIKDSDGNIVKYIGARYHILEDSIAEELYNKQAKELGLKLIK